MEDCNKDENSNAGEKEACETAAEESATDVDNNQENVSLTKEDAEPNTNVTTNVEEVMKLPETANSSEEQEEITSTDQTPSRDAENIASPPISQEPQSMNVESEELGENVINSIAEDVSEAQDTNIQNPETDSIPNKAVIEKLFSSALGHIASEYRFSSGESIDGEDEDEDNAMETSILPSNLVLNPAAHYHRALAKSPSSSSSSSDSDSDVEFISQINNAMQPPIEIEDDDEETSTKPREPIRAKGELLLVDLPPIEDLHITVPEEECVELGKVHSIVDQLVLVDTIPGTAYLNLDTVLFLEKGNKVLGAVFDVIGQITNPLYCVRFNSNKHIKEKGIEVGQTVYVAPRTEHTQFLILDNLMTIRGSDASWEDDVEPPEKHLDYSDDEEERNARRAIKNRNKSQSEENDSTKKARPTHRPQRAPQQEQQQQYHQQNRFNRPRYQGAGYQQRNPYPNQDANYQPPFQYNSHHTAWHANYAYPPPPTYYSNTYPNPQYPPGPSNAPFPSPNQFNPSFSPPNYPGQHFPVRNQFNPQFAPPPSNMPPPQNYGPNLPPPPGPPMH